MKSDSTSLMHSLHQACASRRILSCFFSYQRMAKDYWPTGCVVVVVVAVALLLQPLFVYQVYHDSMRLFCLTVFFWPTI